MQVLTNHEITELSYHDSARFSLHLHTDANANLALRFRVYVPLNTQPAKK